MKNNRSPLFSVVKGATHKLRNSVSAADKLYPIMLVVPTGGVEEVGHPLTCQVLRVLCCHLVANRQV